MRSIEVRGVVASVLAASMCLGCASLFQKHETDRDRTAKGAGFGAPAGALGSILLGKHDADEILLGAALDGIVGGSVGAYMDEQEEKIARIPGTTVERVDRETLLVRFESDVLFPVDSARLTRGARSTVQHLSDVLIEYDKTAVVVQGHTDSIGIAAYNQDLSVRRADAVVDALAADGVDGRRMVGRGLGEDYPVGDSGTEEGRRLNRRVTVLLRARATQPDRVFL